MRPGMLTEVRGTRGTLWVCFALAGACDGEPTEVGPPPARGVPSRPRIVTPELGAPVVVPPELRATRLRSAPTIPPNVRGPSQVDTFTQDQAVVDVLFVVDNSGTLTNERDELAREFDRFITVLLAAEVDFHVGVTSTDMSFETGDRGRLRGSPRFITRSTPDPELVFSRAVTFSQGREVAHEQGLLAISAALSPPLVDLENQGFLRPDAALAVIVVSDEDDQSIGTPESYVRFLAALKPPGRAANISLSAVVGEAPDGCYPPGEEGLFGAHAEVGERYLHVSAATGGLEQSICAADFGPFVDELATRLAALRRVFPLSAPPVLSSIRVRIDGVLVPESTTNGWSLRADGRSIELSPNRTPRPGSEIRIEYAVDL